MRRGAEDAKGVGKGEGASDGEERKRRRRRRTREKERISVGEGKWGVEREVKEEIEGRRRMGREGREVNEIEVSKRMEGKQGGEGRRTTSVSADIANWARARRYSSGVLVRRSFAACSALGKREGR